MSDWLWYAILGVNLGSTVSCWYTIVWCWRRYEHNEQAQFLRWQRLEEEQTRAWVQRMCDVQAACPFCGCASADDA